MKRIDRIGETKLNYKNEKMTIVNYINCDNIIVKFENGIEVNSNYNNFKLGKTSIKSFKNRLNETSINNYNREMKIIKYINNKDITIQFEDGCITNTTYQCFKEGNIISPYDKTICGVGYLGEGIYSIKINNILSKEYKEWYSMINRCYSDKYKSNKPTYKCCSVSEEWHNFQNFAKWFHENYYKVESEQMNLDKDILYKGNKIYSPNTCVFVPRNINLLFIKSDASRGEYPIGVNFNKKDNNYMARCCTNDGKRDIIGLYTTPEEAFYDGYKPFKEKVIKKVADTYKDKIPQKLYDSLYRYEVEITD